MKRIALSISAALFLASCGGGSGEAPANEANEAANTPMEETTPAEEAVEEAPAAVTLELKATGESMNEMAYEPARLEVPAGAEVTVNMENTASAAGMIHNVVFIKRGAQEEVSMAGLEAGKDAQFVPEGNENVIAYSAIANPGESVSVTFTAPAEAGTYQFICTYPGHTAMKGILLVK